jgi:hypothetical protein
VWGRRGKTWRGNREVRRVGDELHRDHDARSSESDFGPLTAVGERELGGGWRSVWEVSEGRVMSEGEVEARVWLI